MSDFDTLVDLLRWRALRQPLDRACTWLEDGETREVHLTYGQLDRKARAVAAHLRERTRPGDRILLAYPAGLDYVAAFFGCLYAGAVAVPVYPPRPNRSLGRLQAVIHDARPAAALTSGAVLAQVDACRADAPLLQQLPWLDTATLDENAAGAWSPPALGRDSLAFLQYTSGSTAVPKGVMVTHGNLQVNERMIQESFEHDAGTVAVGWLPLYHDMGLIGNLLQPLYLGTRVVLLSPFAFLQRPRRWLEAISRHRATTSGAPNFAYDLCARRTPPEVRDTLDLSCWRVAYVGAEPVRAATLELFAETFAPCGFRRSAFLGCYGLAEATLFVTGARPAQALAVEAEALEQDRVVLAANQDPHARTLVSCGRPGAGTQVVIVDPQTNLSLPPGRVGEVWVRGPQVAHGYWGNPAATRDVFHGRLAGQDEGPFLRTGDLGFLRDGELFVTGRLKDLIIVDGRNHYPQDFEWTVERSHPALRPHGGAAFAVERDNAERLVVVHELERHGLGVPREEILAAARKAVAAEHDVALFDLQLLRPGSLPKTSSGKVQRSLCRDLYLRGGLELAHPAPAVRCPAAAATSLAV
jgi:acyl-CoA synthetase (AMP-forming)/AMP-acid ligase II